MGLRFVFLAGVLVLLAAGAWRVVESGAVARWLHPLAPAAKAIVFDNGSVRQGASAPPADGAEAVKQPIAIGAARKCRQGGKVTYTDVPCPKGAEEQAIGGHVSVLEGQAAAKAPLSAPGPSEKRRKTSLEALDESDNQNLRDQRIERAVNR